MFAFCVYFHAGQTIKLYPKCAILMRCTKCHQERKPTDEEMIKYHIPTYKEYFDERKRKEIEEDKKSWEKAIQCIHRNVLSERTLPNAVKS